MKDLCLALSTSETKAEITQTLKDAGFWDTSSGHFIKYRIL